MSLAFENPAFIILGATGFVFIILGVVMYRFPPKDINSFYGYRTRSSMKSKERWDFAQKYSSIELMRMGLVMVFTSLLSLFYNPLGTLALVLGIGLLILVIGILLWRVERAIKSLFDSGL